MQRTRLFSKTFLLSCAASLAIIGFANIAIAAEDEPFDIDSRSQKKQRLMAEETNGVFAPSLHTKIKSKKGEVKPKRSSTQSRKASSRDSVSITALSISDLQEQEILPQTTLTMPFTILELKTHLTQRIIGQDAAMTELATSIHAHLVGQKINKLISENPEEAKKQGYTPIKGSHILLTGQNGCGKTAALTCVRDFLQTHSADLDLRFPIVFQNHKTGAEGDSLTDTLKDIIYSDDFSLKEIEHAIIFIDDIDLQLFSQDTEEKRVKSAEIQESWLPLIRGTNIYFETKLADDK